MGHFGCEKTLLMLADHFYCPWFLEEVTVDLRLRLFCVSLLVPWEVTEGFLCVFLLVRCVPRVLILHEQTRLGGPGEVA
jgi:hypothetical protein